MIRATRNGMFDLIGSNSARLQSSLRRVEEQASSGLVMNRPSDLPESVSLVHSLDASIADQATWQENAQMASSVLTSMDEALGRVGDVLLRAREIALAMSGDTVGADARAVAAVEVRGLQEALADSANAQFNGRYVFAGRAWDTPPFDSAGVYSGDSTEPQTRVGDERWVRSGLVGSDVFAGASDIFGTLEALAVGLEANDPTAVSDTIDDLDAGTRAVNTWRGEVGSEVNASEDAIEVSENLEALFDTQLNATISADPVATYGRLAELRSSYEATLQVAASASGTSLFDLLR